MSFLGCYNTKNWSRSEKGTYKGKLSPNECFKTNNNVNVGIENNGECWLRPNNNLPPSNDIVAASECNNGQGAPHRVAIYGLNQGTCGKDPFYPHLDNRQSMKNCNLVWPKDDKCPTGWTHGNGACCLNSQDCWSCCQALDYYRKKHNLHAWGNCNGRRLTKDTSDSKSKQIRRCQWTLWCAKRGKQSLGNGPGSCLE